ncbi:unnamed protein product, partial [marine sediment metagenome]
GETKRETRDGRTITIHTEIKDLFEISCCAVPANPEALSKSARRKHEFVLRRKAEAEKKKILENPDTLEELFVRSRKPGESFTLAEQELLEKFDKDAQDFAELTFSPELDLDHGKDFDGLESDVEPEPDYAALVGS